MRRHVQSFPRRHGSLGQQQDEFAGRQNYIENIPADEACIIGREAQPLHNIFQARLLNLVGLPLSVDQCCRGAGLHVTYSLRYSFLKCLEEPQLR
jgi:recombinational DNA repair protein (RecF pathway)